METKVVSVYLLGSAYLGPIKGIQPHTRHNYWAAGQVRYQLRGRKFDQGCIRNFVANAYTGQRGPLVGKSTDLRTGRLLRTWMLSHKPYTFVLFKGIVNPDWVSCLLGYGWCAIRQIISSHKLNMNSVFQWNAANYFYRTAAPGTILWVSPSCLNQF